MQRLCFLGLALVALLAGCGEQQSGQQHPGQAASKPVPLTAATLGEQRIVPNADFLSSEPYLTASQDGGAAQAQVCRACHSLEAGGANMIGPNLYGMFGKVAGFHPDFDYSEVLENADFRWTPRALDAWLAEPARFLPGNRMSFVGVPDSANRQALIAYLLRTTDDQPGE